MADWELNNRSRRGGEERVPEPNRLQVLFFVLTIENSLADTDHTLLTSGGQAAMAVLGLSQRAEQFSDGADDP